jgi:hypothetical protein
MIWRAAVLLVLSIMCLATVVEAADLPAYPVVKAAKPIKKAPKPKKTVLVAPPVETIKTPKAAAVKTASKIPKTAVEPAGTEISLTWVLDPLVANSDGAKREDSAGVEANLVVTEPGNAIRPAMVIELTGHVIKTARTSVRLDIRVGSVRRIVNWNSDDIQSGKFNISLNGAMTAEKLPAYIPVSALAFVTKDGKEGAAMVSLEKVVVRLGNVDLATSIKDPATPEITGSISTD